MKSCAYCGRANEDDAMRCRECGTAQFVLPASPGTSSQGQSERVAEVQDPECDVPADDEAALCTNCLFPNLPDASLCKRCGASMSYASIVGPLDAALASGFMWRGAVRGRPKPFVLVSVWVLFFPSLLWNLLVALSILTVGMTGPASLAMLWFALGFAAVAFMMLYQVTRNYLTIPRRHLDEPFGT
jgi:ribosomal protein L40E